jgi:hypothetical protein
MSDWLNNETIVFKHAIKPCKICKFCPYGQLVEEFPLPSIPRKVAVQHNNYMKDAIAKGTFDKKDPEMPFLMTREEAEAEVASFNEEDYPIESNRDYMACEVYGHICPVYYHAEPMSEDGEVTDEEVDAWIDELDKVYE